MLLPEILKLQADLQKVNQILNNERFEQSFTEKFNIAIVGVQSLSIRLYIRLMVLKYSNEWCYKTLEKMVNDSITLKKFYRVPLDKPMLDSTTLIKLNQQYGGDTLKELNRLLMHKLAE